MYLAVHIKHNKDLCLPNKNEKVKEQGGSPSPLKIFYYELKRSRIQKYIDKRRTDKRRDEKSLLRQKKYLLYIRCVQKYTYIKGIINIMYLKKT